jgi:hypothetical protein
LVAVSWRVFGAACTLAFASGKTAKVFTVRAPLQSCAWLAVFERRVSTTASRAPRSFSAAAMLPPIVAAARAVGGTRLISATVLS